MSCEATSTFTLNNGKSYDHTNLQASGYAHTFGDGPFFGRIASFYEVIVTAVLWLTDAGCNFCTEHLPSVVSSSLSYTSRALAACCPCNCLVHDRNYGQQVCDSSRNRMRYGRSSWSVYRFVQCIRTCIRLKSLAPLYSYLTLQALRMGLSKPSDTRCADPLGSYHKLRARQSKPQLIAGFAGARHIQDSICGADDFE